jgi:hypothetical protein
LTLQVPASRKRDSSIATAQKTPEAYRNQVDSMKTSATKTPIGKVAGFLVAALLLPVLTGCFAAENTTGSGTVRENETVALKIRMGVGSVNALRKSSVISLEKLVVVLSSSANDTIRDTITDATTPALNPVSTTGQTVEKNYTLNALRTWKIVVTSRDALDSVIHRDSSIIPALYAGDTALVNLNLSSKFTMYEARFLSLPDSIRSQTLSQPKQKLCINRLVLKIDAITVRDSVSTAPCFDSLTTHTLSYDYVATGNRTVQLLAYGPMNYWDEEAPLFSGSTSINAGSGVDATVALNLTWVGPTTGIGHLEVELGKVGKVTVNGTLPGTVML